jgi:hypothetical protein
MKKERTSPKEERLRLPVPTKRQPQGNDQS